MTDRNQVRGEQRRDQPLRQDEDQRPGQQEAQADARPNVNRSEDEEGRVAGRSGSESDAD
jgi:hypothetical protein